MAPVVQCAVEKEYIARQTAGVRYKGGPWPLPAACDFYQTDSASRDTAGQQITYTEFCGHGGKYRHIEAAVRVAGRDHQLIRCYVLYL
jgi:hypothetical protein